MALLAANLKPEVPSDVFFSPLPFDAEVAYICNFWSLKFVILRSERTETFRDNLSELAILRGHISQGFSDSASTSVVSFAGLNPTSVRARFRGILSGHRARENDIYFLEKY